MSDYDMSIHSSTDAREWTDFFFKTYPNCNVDRETLIGWFANAMMAMYDNAETVNMAQWLEEYKKGYVRAEQQLKREPLSKEEYMSLFIDTYHSETPITDFVRLIEKAHGIGVENG